MLVKELKKVLTLSNEYHVDNNGNFLPAEKVWSKSFIMEPTENNKEKWVFDQIDFGDDEEGILNDLRVIHVDAALTFCDGFGPCPWFTVWVEFNKEIWEKSLNEPLPSF